MKEDKMPEYWDLFIERQLKAERYYFTDTAISEILKDFYYFLKREGQIRI